MTLFRYLLLVSGMLLGVPLLLLLLLIPKTPITFAGVISLLGFLLVAIGMVLALWKSSYSLALISIGSAFAFGTMAIRIMFPPSGSQLNMITLPSQTGPRLLTRILNEQDAVLFGSQVAPSVGVVTQNEKVYLIPAFSKAYQEMKLEGATPLSPFLTTYLNLQKPGRFDALVAEPGATPNSGILFLHGYGGNFTVQCWLIAKAGDSIDALTVCPSTSVSAQWWDPQGQAILQETLDYLHQRGVKRIYLAGLSNGGIGASRLADSYQEEIDGLILISGADPNAVITNLPVLVIHGKSDERIPVAMMEQYGAVSGPNATYRLFEGDHFLLLKQAEQVQEVISEWLLEQEKNSHNS